MELTLYLAFSKAGSTLSNFVLISDFFTLFTYVLYAISSYNFTEFIFFYSAS